MYDNYHYPAGADNEQAPWNQVDVPEKEFDVTCCQTLASTVSVTTNNYIPGACGVDYEPDDEGGYCACGYQEDDDTSETNWSKEYEGNGYHTPLQLIHMLQEYLEKDLRALQVDMLPNDRSFKVTQVRRLKHLIEECEGFEEIETDFAL